MLYKTNGHQKLELVLKDEKASQVSLTRTGKSYIIPTLLTSGSVKNKEAAVFKTIAPFMSLLHKEYLRKPKQLKDM